MRIHLAGQMEVKSRAAAEAPISVFRRVHTVLWAQPSFHPKTALMREGKLAAGCDAQGKNVPSICRRHIATSIRHSNTTVRQMGQFWFA